MNALLTIALASLAGGGQPAQPGPAPTFQVVSEVAKEKGQIFFNELKYRKESVQVEREVVVNGMMVKQVVTEQVVVSELIKTAIDLGQARVITPDGKQLALDEVFKRLKKDTIVVVSGNANTPGQPYLRALSPDALIIIPPADKNIPMPK
jgi:hypothetical protein